MVKPKMPQELNEAAIFHFPLSMIMIEPKSSLACITYKIKYDENLILSQPLIQSTIVDDYVQPNITYCCNPQIAFLSIAGNCGILFSLLLSGIFASLERICW